MRVWLAGLFVFSGLLLAVALLPDVMGLASSILVGIGLVIFAVVLILFAAVAFNVSWGKPGEFKSEAEYTQELEDKGLLVSTDYTAVRAFEVWADEDEGSHYFIELEDKSILYLNDGCLYGYGLIEDGEDEQPRSFPCTGFTVRRHRDEGYVVDVICRGSLLEAESMEPEFLLTLESLRKMPDVGDIITEMTFDELKQL